MWANCIIHISSVKLTSLFYDNIKVVLGHDNHHYLQSFCALFYIKCFNELFIIAARARRISLGVRMPLADIVHDICREMSCHFQRLLLPHQPTNKMCRRSNPIGWGRDHINENNASIFEVCNSQNGTTGFVWKRQLSDLTELIYQTLINVHGPQPLAN